ncbi:FecR family protein [Flagellimonas onchidii]|uniref:FecR family protein n=1 Tax=Flagellimonas onchidii TaxID=2562684 RepID=UPI0010A69B37|nr:FecR domain-containing protein [Allomuricauda onchidii]
MKYKQFEEEDFLKDEYFQKWVLDNDSMVQNFWENWLRENPEKKKIVESASKLIKLLAVDHTELSEDGFGEMWQNIVQNRKDSVDSIFSPKPKKRKARILLRTVAVFAAIFVSALGVKMSGVFKKIEVVYPDSEVTLELQDGSVRVLDEASMQEITDAKGQMIVNQDKSRLIYESRNDKLSKTIAFNTLTVPYGKKFELRLSDGTKVFLNSGTSLRYPVEFLDNKPRNVFLDGEAYFSVEKDEERPFTVITDEMNTQVYGTEFNVSSYKNERNTSTVLVEGSVGVYKSNNGNGQKPVGITPGQRAVFEEDVISIEKVNVKKYTAWVNGELFFVEDRFELIIKELERHFDVEIDNQYADLNRIRFTGTFADESLDQILRIFNEHTPFDYALKGGVVTLMKK